MQDKKYNPYKVNGFISDQKASCKLNAEASFFNVVHVYFNNI